MLSILDQIAHLISLLYTVYLYGISSIVAVHYQKYMIVLNISYVQLVITGVAVGSAGYKLMQSDEVRFLDVIEELNGQPFSSLQQPFAEAVKDLPSIRMLLKRPISLPPASKFLSESKFYYRRLGNFCL